MTIYRVAAWIALALSCSAVQSQTVATQIGVSENHCSEIQGTVDNKTFVCMVWNHDPQRFAQPHRLEVYRNRKLIVTIQPGTAIREWHFWKNGEQLSIHAGKGNAGTFLLYDTATGKLVDQVNTPVRPSELPQWAKDRSELDDESVPEGAAYSQLRTLWIAKVIKQIHSIHPGMTRRDLQSIFTTEGGLFARTQRTYVYKDCPYIKVDVVFSGTGATWAEDRIVSISRPYLEFSIMD